MKLLALAIQAAKRVVNELVAFAQAEEGTHFPLDLDEELVISTIG